MNYSLLITGSPTASRACHSALDFAEAAVANGDNTIQGIFFYEEAVAIASSLAMPPRDECNIRDEWSVFAKQHNIPLYVCIAAALRRGQLNEAEAKRHEVEHFNLADGYQLEGLGSLVSLTLESDRIVRFK
ncbi:MAG: sulfurtransferase complex subunit TusD [Marinomonas sp.]|nr:sulfurtransferase complex subunit TusD [Marinomonas sp.]RUM49537.1 MAG: sulfurtransferase complex subunit TusD [Marinomonas sp.]